MEIEKEKLAAMAADCHSKQVAMQSLHELMQKGGTTETAAQYAIAKVEYRRAKNLLDLEINNQSVTIVSKT